MKHSHLRKFIVRRLKHGNPDQKWFKRHPDRQYRIRPKRPDESGKGLSILKKVTPECRTSVDIDPEGVMLADNDEVLGKVYRVVRDGRRCLTFTFDGNVLGEEQFEL